MKSLLGGHPRIGYARSASTRNKDGNEPLRPKRGFALDAIETQLCQPPRQDVVVRDMDPRSFRGEQTGEVAEIVVCMGLIEEHDTAVRLRDQSDMVNRDGQCFEFYPNLPSSRCRPPR